MNKKSRKVGMYSLLAIEAMAVADVTANEYSD